MALHETEGKKNKNAKESESLRTVQRALDILGCFSVEQAELSLTEIANMISLAKSTTTRLLLTLEQNGYVVKNSETLRYRLGSKLFYLGHVVGQSMQFREIARPFMKRVRDEAKETVNLYVLEDMNRVCVEQVEGPLAIRHMVQIGQKLPLAVGAGGKVLLAFQDKSFQTQVLNDLDSEERRNKLANELELIRKVGYAISRDERELGSSAVAAPIFDMKGKVHSCISISGPSLRFTDEKVDRIKQITKMEALQISRSIGFIEEKANI
ncbi:IclR family transcriptional regulator [Ammoniphilus sp. 3BR4]|uniref:IclR family transcriptional regulator n=1 Tax=Ammoniphilus sp. 3BR4 TaxID=3158265 RepID=UPI003465DD63